ncbi:MAG: hypothetical protein Q4G63_01570 [Bacteroidia bacterium]|nr:hypothetical protein [Bacteroidia bacterium]
MKNIKFVFYLLLIILSSSCMDTYTEDYMANVPVYLSYSDLRSAVKTLPAKDLEKPGKIYFKDNYLLIVEKMKGFHVVDVSVPSNPKNISFVEVPGCVDIAVKNNILYADSYIDLVALDVADVNKIKEVNRLKDIFPYAVPPTENEYRTGNVNKEKGVVVGWEQKREHNKLEEQTVYPVYYGWETYHKSPNFSFDALNANTGGISSTSFGKGGSMARFGLYDNFLYTADRHQLFVFNVSEASKPQKVVTQSIGWNVETMFLYDNHMFLGTTDGMIILELVNPSAPRQISSFRHVTTCDPVVVQDGYAYITLRSGVTCNRAPNATVNVLDVVKLSDDYKTNNLIATYNMKAPYGLGIDKNTLFLCDDGLKVYNVADKLNINNNLIAHFKDIKTFDVIPLNKFLFMIGEDGFYLYDYTDLQNIKQLGSIPVKK